MYRLSGSGIRFLSTLLLMIGEICLAEQIEKPFCHYFTYWGSFNFLSQRRAQRSSFIRKRKQVHEPLHKFLLFVSKDLCSRFHHKFLPLPFAFALPLPFAFAFRLHFPLPCAERRMSRSMAKTALLVIDMQARILHCVFFLLFFEHTHTHTHTQ